MASGHETQTESMDAIAVRFKVSKAAVSKWRKAGCPARQQGRRFFFDPLEVAAWRERHRRGEGHGGRRARTQGRGTGTAGGNGAADLKQQLDLADLRKKLAAAEKAELELAERRGELVRRDEVEASQATRVAYARAVLMGEPAGLAPDLVDLVHRCKTKEKAIAKVEAALLKSRNRALRELAGG